MNQVSAFLRSELSCRLLAPFCVLAAALLTACKPPPPPEPCPTPPAVDGHVTVEFEGSQARMRMPVGLANMYWTADCKYLTGMNMEFQWHENKLFSGKRIFGPDFFLIRVAIDPVGKPPPHIKPLEAWQFEPALPHPKYPIEFYPRTAWVGPDNPKTKYPPPALWGVRGTMDPQTRRPYRTGCNISPLDANRPESVVESDFPRDYGDAKCVGGIPVVNGKSSVSVRVEIPATGMPHIDRIYNAVSEFITPLVLE